jgi:hypothetical protein
VKDQVASSCIISTCTGRNVTLWTGSN